MGWREGRLSQAGGGGYETRVGRNIKLDNSIMILLQQKIAIRKVFECNKNGMKRMKKHTRHI